MSDLKDTCCFWYILEPFINQNPATYVDMDQRNTPATELVDTVVTYHYSRSRRQDRLTLLLVAAVGAPAQANLHP